MSTPIDPPAATGAQAGQPEAEAREPEAGQPQIGRPQTGQPEDARPQAGSPVPPSTPYLPAIIGGLVVLTVTVLVALAKLTDVEVDLGLVLPVAMVAAGALLVLGAVLAAVRAGRRGEG